jgi:hypothetical protein
MIDIQKLKERFLEVECKQDFDDLKLNYSMSSADLADRDEAIRLLELEFPHYCNVDKRNADILKSIKDGEADMPNLD